MKRIIKLVNRPPIAGVFIALLVFVTVLNARMRGWFQYLELKAYDQLLNLQHRDTRAAGQIVIVGIDEVDIRGMGRASITDSNLAKLINRLGELGAASIGLDLFRDQPEGEGGRAALIEAIRNNHVYCIEYPSSEPTRAVMTAAEIYGLWPPQVVTCENSFDDDQEARRACLYVRASASVWKGLQTKKKESLGGPSHYPEPDLSVAVVNHFLSTRNPNTPAEWRSKTSAELDMRPWTALVGRFESNTAAYGASIPQVGYEYLMDFKGPNVRRQSDAGPDDAIRLSLRQLLDRKDFPQWQTTGPEDVLPSVTNEHNSIKGKIVLIGEEAISVKDYVSCPRGAYFRGVEYHALAADYLLRAWRGWAQPRRFWTHQGEAIWILIWSLLGVGIGFRFASLGRMMLFCIGGVLALLLIVYFFFMGNWWLPSIPPAICFIGSAGLMTGYLSQHERGQRSLLNNLFKRIAGSDVVKEVWAKRDDIFENGRLVPRVVTASVLFVDFEGFAKRAEQLGTPVRLIEWLDETMQAFTKVILKENGAILKYMGDSIMVAFGAPLYRETEEEHATDARQSVQCALALRRKLVQLNGEWTRRGEPTLRMRIGICTGEVGAGTIGSGNRLEYAVLGDTTNTASRLENCMKERMGTEVAVDNCRIFISGSTNRYCAEFFDTRYIGEVDVRKPTPAHVYAVMDVKLRGGAPAPSEAGVRPPVQQQAPSES